MAVNTDEIAATYSALLASTTASVGGMWDRNEIDAETYANIISKASVDLISMSADLVQKQEQLDKDLDIKERQMLEAEATGSKQRIAIDKDNLLKDDELLINEKKKAQIEADTTERLDSTTRANSQLADQLLTSAKQRILLDEEKETADAQQVLLAKDIEVKDADISYKGKQEDLVDSQIVGSGYDNEVKAEQVLMSEYEREFMQPKQLEKLDTDINIAERNMLDKEATSEKQRILLNTEEDTKQFELNNLLPKQEVKLDEEIDLLQTQDDEMKKNGSTDRDAKERQIIEAEIANEHKRTVLDVQDIKESQSRIDAGILDVQLRTWSSAFNGGKLDNIPNMLTNSEIRNTYEHVSADIPTAP